MCGGAAPDRLARSSVGDVRSPGNNGIAGTDLPPIYYENKQHYVSETLEGLVTIYIIYSHQEKSEPSASDDAKNGGGAQRSINP